MTRITVLSSSYVLYLSLLLSCSKVNLACENTPIKQWRKWALYKVHGSLQAVCPENSAQAAFLYAHCPAPVSQPEKEADLNPVQWGFESRLRRSQIILYVPIIPLINAVHPVFWVSWAFSPPISFDLPFRICLFPAISFIHKALSRLLLQKRLTASPAISLSTVS